MTDNEKLAKWAGFNDLMIRAACPNYCRRDSEAVELLNVLVEKGLEAQVWTANKEWGLTINYYHYPINGEGTYPTIHEAITSAVLAMIKKETICELNTEYVK